MMKKFKELLPSVRDLHIYGGIVLVAVGLGHFNWRYGMIVAGVCLALLGRPWR